MSKLLASKIKVALIQLSGSTPDKTANLARAAHFVEKAMTQHPETKIVVLPESFSVPYEMSKFRDYSEVISPEATSIRALSDIASKWKITLVGGSIPELDPETSKIYNTSVIFNESGEIIGKHRKVHLFDISIPNGIKFKESNTLSGGSDLTHVKSTVGKFGVGICYDIRFPELAMLAARDNAFAMIYPSAFNTITGPMHWHLLARSRSLDNQIYTLLCSPARNLEAKYHAYGHSLVVNPNGEVIAEAGEGEEIIFADLDPADIEKARSSIPVSTQRRFDVYPDVSAGLRTP
ncbi:HFL026Wp [Eremothecium sinecaudum]|uniref:HFL026Wp n=1 Tax=Eremothecium sinecaudum TaxID=45286 RepID=A0A0X8HUV3_9SACH|nr:HFL026Wp [Eremothecium sinecaudum]AMD21830.1 HFL026Wp [Eremothecium sinecaudum]